MLLGRARRRDPLFHDRVDAGKQLGATLAERFPAHRVDHMLVLGLPRGGVPVAAEVALALGADLDVLVTRKIGAPLQPELAIGALTAQDGLYLDMVMIEHVGVTNEVLDQLIANERETAKRQEQRFRGDRPQPPIEGRTVFVVDDGLATGATMRAAAHAINHRRPARVIAAVPVGSVSGCSTMEQEVDEVVCLSAQEPFHAVGLHYAHFDQTEDSEVEGILNQFRRTSTE